MMSGQIDDVYGFYSAFQFQGDERIFPEVVTETQQKSFDVVDTFVTADYTDAFRVRAGLTKDPLIREDNESCFEPLRSLRLCLYRSAEAESRFRRSPLGK
jgi:hypothetical protein